MFELSLNPGSQGFSTSSLDVQLSLLVDFTHHYRTPTNEIRIPLWQSCRYNLLQYSTLRDMVIRQKSFRDCAQTFAVFRVSTVLFNIVDIISSL
jgi:hypothetical protein